MNLHLDLFFHAFARWIVDLIVSLTSSRTPLNGRSTRLYAVELSEYIKEKEAAAWDAAFASTSQRALLTLAAAAKRAVFYTFVAWLVSVAAQIHLSCRLFLPENAGNKTIVEACPIMAAPVTTGKSSATAAVAAAHKPPSALKRAKWKEMM